MEQISVSNKRISALKLNANTIETLKNNRINTLKKLSQQKWRDLINLGLSKEEAKKVEIELQLQGLDIKRNL